MDIIIKGFNFNASFIPKSIIMKKLIILLFLIVQTGLLQSQTLSWQKLIGGSDADKGTCFLSPFSFVNPGPNLIIGGYYKSVDGDFTGNHGNYDIFVMSFDNNGNELWQTTFGGSNADYIYDMAFDGTDIIVVGTTKSTDGDIPSNHGNYDYLVAKLNTSGNIIWIKTFGGSDIDKATSVIVDNATIKVLGYKKSTDGDVTPGTAYGQYDVWLINLDTNGNLLSQHTYGGASDDKSNQIYKNPSDNNIFVAAYSKSDNGDLTENHGNYDYWIFKIDANDDIVWQKSYGGSGIDKEPRITGQSGTMFVVGTSNSNDGDITAPKGNFDIWFTQLDWNTGHLISQVNIGGSGADFATGIFDTPLMVRSTNSPIGYISAYSNSDDGDFTTNNGNYDSWLLGFDFNNNYNTFHLGGDDVDELMAIDFNYVLGKTKSNNGDFSDQHGNYDVWLINADMPLDSGSILQPEIKVKTFPNPVIDFVKIEADEILKIEVFDMSGKMIKSYKLPALIDIANLNLSDLAGGEYLVKTITKNGYSINKITKK